MSITAILILAALGVGGAGGWWVTSRSQQAAVAEAQSQAAQAEADARSAEAAARAVDEVADVVEEAAREGVLQAGVGAELASFERARLVCEGGTDPAACLTVLCWQMTQAREGQAQGVDCSAMANLWLSGRILDRCEAAPNPEARTRCYKVIESRK